MTSSQKQAFDLSQEPDAIREMYGSRAAVPARTSGGKMTGGG